MGKGPTRTAGVVVRPLRWLSLHANRSDSFQPAGPALSLDLKRLPDPQGQGRGLRFLAEPVRRQTRPARQPVHHEGHWHARRHRRHDRDAHSLRRSPQRAGAKRLARHLSTPAEGRAMGHRSRRSGGPHVDARPTSRRRPRASWACRRSFSIRSNIRSPRPTTRSRKGREIELNYNPTAHWTMKLNFAQQESIDANLAPEVSAWLAPADRALEDDHRSDDQPAVVHRALQQRDARRGLHRQQCDGSARAGAGDRRQEPSADPEVSRELQHQLPARPASPIIESGNVSTSAARCAGRTRPRSATTAWSNSRRSSPRSIPTARSTTRRNLYIDAFIGYRTRLFSDKVAASFQLNARNITEDGRLQKINAYPDGSPSAFRIVDRRQFILSASFDL